MPRTKISRAKERLVSAAIDYCAADAVAVAARLQLSELASKHDPYDVICCIPPPQTDFDSEPRKLSLRRNGASTAQGTSMNQSMAQPPVGVVVPRGSG
jgi:hypothetical protein